MIISLQMVYNEYNNKLDGLNYNIMKYNNLDTNQNTNPNTNIDTNPENKDNIYVMTYNVHNNAMLNDTKLNNIATIINGIDNSWDNKYKHPGTFDFIATQEATDNWKKLYDKIDRDKDKYGSVDSRKYRSKETTNNYHHITYYNKSKYTIVKNKSKSKNKSKNKNEVKPFDAGREKHYILFQNKETKKKYLFINIHNKHKADNSGNTLQGKITDAIKTLNLTETSIIIAGDFNDEGRKYYKGINITTNNHGTFNIKCDIDDSKIPKSINDKITDYVISDKSLRVKKIYIPLSVDWRDRSNHQQSDHYPVVAIL